VGEGAARIGVFGGTFDPIHIGHLVAAVNVRHALELDSVLMVVAGEPWQKVGARPISPAEDRFAMVAAAVEGVDGLEASRIEVDRPRPSYTADTLEALLAEDPGVRLFLIIGQDVADRLHTWKRPADVARLATLVIVNRAVVGAAPPVDLPGWEVERVMIPPLAVSSSDLRGRASRGEPLDYLVPEAALRCIHERGLYAGGR